MSTTTRGRLSTGKQEKATASGSGTHRGRRASGRVMQKEITFAILVDVAIPSTGELVVENMDNWALRKFTYVGKEQLPRGSKDTDPSLSPTIELHEIGSRAPSKGATFAVLQWMQERQHIDKPGCIQGNDLGDDRADDIEFLINAYAACSALRTTFGLWDLEVYIKSKIEEHGINEQQLAAMWELLPHDHLITRHAVKWLVIQQVFGGLEDFEAICPGYVRTQSELEAIWDEEWERAEAKFRKQKRSRRDPEP